MRIFVISLTSAAKRRAEAASQLAGLSLDFEFFDAVERVKDAFRYFDGFDQRLYKLNTRRLPLPGEIGCFASHKALWQKCVELNEPIIILEDDFSLAENFAAVITDLESLTNKFGFIRLQSHKRIRKWFRLSQRRSDYRLPDIPDAQMRYLSNVPLCLLAYAISPSAAASLVNSSNILSAPVDKFMQKTWVHSTPIFAFEEPVVSLSVHANETTIGVRYEKSRNIGLLLGRLLYKGFGQFQRSRFDRAQLRRLGISPGSENPSPVDIDSRSFPVHE